MAKTIEFTVTGAEEISRKLGYLGQHGLAAVSKGLFRVGQVIMTDSKENYVPVDTGALRSTGRVEPPEIKGNEVVVTLGFGGLAGGGAHRGRSGATPANPVGYALQVHEQNKNYVTGQWKYLETPLKNHSGEILPEVVNELHKLLPGRMW